MEQQCKEKNRATKEGIIVMKQLESVLMWEKKIWRVRGEVQVLYFIQKERKTSLRFTQPKVL
jgi:hypothetical protein